MNDTASFSQMVVVGSSAGGIDALTTLVGTLPADFPAPVVVAQHLDPSRESHLREILSRSSTLPVRTPAVDERLEPGVVYVVPANRDVEITDHDIRLTTGTHRSRPSIDLLFTSAAEVFGQNLIAVVLTGTGNDGAAGALEVQQAGGTVIIQDPVTASFPALPRSLAPSAVDFVVPLDQMGDLLQRLMSTPLAPTSADEDDALLRLLRLLRDEQSIDFLSYKPATIMRRLQRRLAATGAANVQDYVKYVEQNPDEQHAIIASFLIKVTKFFRDPELFSALRDRILPDIIDAARERDRTIRLWSAGCSTGEEAYSLAILVAETLGDELEQFHVRVFATDLDADAIAFARQGLYASSSLAGVDPTLVDRYFDSVDDSYQIAKNLRGLVIFGQHDLGERAPFPRVDLVLCRNVLIYFTSELQRRTLQLFAFSLRDGGYLILGKSETTAPFPDAFVADDAGLKIYRRSGNPLIVPAAPFRETVPPIFSRSMPTRRTRQAQDLVPPAPEVTGEQPRAQRVESALLNLPTGVVVVDQRYDIQYINDAARTLLGIHTSALGEDLIHLASTVPPQELRALIDRALKEEETAVETLSAVDGSTDRTQNLDVACTPSKVGGGSVHTVTISISDGTTRVQEIQRLEEELARARELQGRAEQQRQNLLATNREILAANGQLTREIDELRAENEGYLVGNEELQAASEEVETLNEELQATNEELETLNEELQATVEELNTTNDDLQTRNLEIQDLAVHLESGRARLQIVIDNLDDAIAVVDSRAATVVTNSRYEQLFAGPLDTLEMQDGGRPLPPDETPQQRGARGESFRMSFRIAGPDGTSGRYEVTGRPIQGKDVEGSVLVIRSTD